MGQHPLKSKLGSAQAQSAAHISEKAADLSKDVGAGRFDLATHKPPRIDSFGYNKETHKGSELLGKFNPNVLSEKV